MSVHSLGRFGNLELFRDHLVQEGRPYRSVALQDVRMVEITMASRGWLLTSALVSLAVGAASAAYAVGFDAPSAFEAAGVTAFMGLVLLGGWFGYRTTTLLVHVDGNLLLAERIGGRREEAAVMFAEKIQAARLGKYGHVKPDTLLPEQAAPTE